MAFLKIENVTYRYPVSDDLVLKDINFEVNKGELCSIIGTNGSGKTTICNVIRGYIPSFFHGEYSGKVTIDNVDIRDYSDGDLALTIGFVFQNPFIQISGVKDTVFEELSYGLENMGVPVPEMKQRIEEVMKMLNITELRDRNPFELSGGQRQRIALASIIVMDPDILVIDEPTSQLDPEGTEEIFRIIKTMKDNGKTIILVEHKMELVAEYSDRIIVMENGEIIRNDIPEKIFSDETLMSKDIDFPQYARLGLALEKKGYDIGETPITEDDAYNMIKKIQSDGGLKYGTN